MIGIVDYGMGNLFSVSKALERLNVPYFISEKSTELKEGRCSHSSGSRGIQRCNGSSQ